MTYIEGGILFTGSTNGCEPIILRDRKNAQFDWSLFQAACGGNFPVCLHLEFVFISMVDVVDSIYLWLPIIMEYTWLREGKCLIL